MSYAQSSSMGIEPAPPAPAHPVREPSELEKSVANMKVTHADGLQEVPEELQKLNKDSFSFAGVVSLGVSCINSWVVLVLALGAGLTSGGPTTSKSYYILTSSPCADDYSGLGVRVCYPVDLLHDPQSRRDVCGLPYRRRAISLGIHGFFAKVPSCRQLVHRDVERHWSMVGYSHCRLSMWYVPFKPRQIMQSPDMIANMVVSIILVNNPSFENTPGTQYGIFVAMTLFAPLSMIFVGNRFNRILEYVLMALSCAGGLAIAVTLLATQTPKASAVRLNIITTPGL